MYQFFSSGQLGCTYGIDVCILGCFGIIKSTVNSSLFTSLDKLLSTKYNIELAKVHHPVK